MNDILALPTGPLAEASLCVVTATESKLIADQLFITGETVKGQVKKILSSLGANDRTRACHHRA